MTEPYQEAGPRTSGLAIASIILGLCSVCLCMGPFTGIPAVICGHIALSNISQSGGTESGRGLAITGLITGYIGICFIILMILAGMLLPALSQAREKARRINCEGNLKSIGLAMKMYSGDYNGHFPTDIGLLWKGDYLVAGKVYVCPSTTHQAPTDTAQLRDGQHLSYVYVGTRLTETCDGRPPQSTVLAYDLPGNHKRFMNVLFADGHVKGFTGTAAESIETLTAENNFYVPPH